jgi:hypothetical protein
MLRLENSHRILWFQRFLFALKRKIGRFFSLQRKIGRFFCWMLMGSEIFSSPDWVFRDFFYTVFSTLHAVCRFGGGPVCNRLVQCQVCQEQLDFMKKRQQYEMETFLKVCAVIGFCFCLFVFFGVLYFFFYLLIQIRSLQLVCTQAYGQYVKFSMLSHQSTKDCRYERSVELEMGGVLCPIAHGAPMCCSSVEAQTMVLLPHLYL